MDFTFDKKGKTIINISKDEETQIIEVIKQLTNELNNFIENEREDLYFEISNFITNDAIKSKLANLKYHIINDLDYNSAFKNVVHFENGQVKFIQNNDLYVFASSYQLIDNTIKAKKVLRNILRVQLIDWLIENDFKQDNADDFIFNIPKNISTSNNLNFRDDIFKSPKEQDLFCFIINDPTKIDTRQNIGAFYSWFCIYLKCSKYDFAVFWNSLNQPFTIKLNTGRSASFENKSTDEMNKRLDGLKVKFEKLEP